MIANVIERPTWQSALVVGAVAIAGTALLIPALRRLYVHIYDEGRIAGYINGARDYARKYDRALSGDRAP